MSTENQTARTTQVADHGINFIPRWQKKTSDRHCQQSSHQIRFEPRVIDLGARTNRLCRACNPSRVFGSAWESCISTMETFWPQCGPLCRFDGECLWNLSSRVERVEGLNGNRVHKEHETAPFSTWLENKTKRLKVSVKSLLPETSHQLKSENSVCLSEHRTARGTKRVLYSYTVAFKQT